ncbi:MAG TPA: type IV toxin-antitoxin system AbiEi family antitoxin domain-containing protein [Actinomycetota bacterium]|nr:type IV toxin-antitoxin system AbiEi family antitoxin domain-containing protein [Actinomycetota bacterium]
MAYDTNVQQRSADQAADRLAARQFGVFRLDQMLAEGVSKGRIRQRIVTGRWEPVARGVYRLRSVGPTWEQTLMISLLGWGAGTVASHRSAAALWSLVGFRRRPIELTVPRNRRRTHPPPGTVYRGALTRADVTTTGAIPVTTPGRTLVDLAATCPRDPVEEALDDALRRTLVTPGRMRAVLGRMCGRPGVTVMRELLEARTGMAPLESRHETRLLRVLLKAGLPRPVPQYETFDASARLIARVDFAYPEYKIAIQADGFAFHGGRLQFQKDREQDRTLQAMGWRVIRVTWEDAEHRPDRIAALIGAMLAAGR